ncbi:MAG: hypothetical protein WDM96_14750 [Lacunisphaera sp.]
MDLATFITLAATGLAVAFIHAAIPTHWLPFVVVARAQGWSRGRALLMVTLCSGGHVLMTTALGVGLAWFGLRINERWGDYYPLVAGGALIALGLLILFRHWRGWTHGHSELLGDHCHHHGHDHAHPIPPIPPARTSDWAAVGGLFAMLTFSPCEGFLPVYLSAVQFGWGGGDAAQPGSRRRHLGCHVDLHLAHAARRREGALQMAGALRGAGAGQPAGGMRRAVHRGGANACALRRSDQRNPLPG